MNVNALKVLRKDNRRRRAKDWRRYLRVVGVIVLVCIVLAAAFAARDRIGVALNDTAAFILDNEYFAVRDIQVRGSEKVGGSEIVAMTGLRYGVNLWKVDAANIEQKVLRHPWVRRVLVRREFPHRVVIDVEERQPRAIVALGKLYYVDSDGLLFKEIDAVEKTSFPLLTGLRADELAAGGPALRKRVQEAMRLGELMTRDARPLSEIHFAGPEQVVIYMTKYPIALRMGWGDWQNKIARLDRVLALWKGHEERLASLDLSFRDQVVARLRRAQPS
ncbi:MAG: FtsQ-type POTRA domain-containing protein [Deltaproteobacteria bacterium]|nr:FtsQ-type POTRA domain-containing protein [Deltaproteobacteria bacterium]